MDILTWLQNNALSLSLPILSGFLAWFFSRNREAAEIKRTSAEEVKTRAEAKHIDGDSYSQLIENCMKINEETTKRYDILKIEYEEMVNKYKKVIASLRTAMTFLLDEMDKYNPDVSKVAKKLLEKS